jgi:hypothetical protein
MEGKHLGRHLFCLDSAATTEEEKIIDCLDYYWKYKNTSETQYWNIPCDMLESHHGTTDVTRVP